VLEFTGFSFRGNVKSVPRLLQQPGHSSFSVKQRGLQRSFELFSLFAQGPDLAAANIHEAGAKGGPYL
jgi:hypothetical protein